MSRAIFCSVQFVLRFLMAVFVEVGKQGFLFSPKPGKLRQIGIEEGTDDGIDHIRTAAVVDDAVVQRIGQVAIQTADQPFALVWLLIRGFQVP